MVRQARFCSQGRGCQSGPLERLGPGAAEAGRASFSLCSLGASSSGIPVWSVAWWPRGNKTSYTVAQSSESEYSKTPW